MSYLRKEIHYIMGIIRNFLIGVWDFVFFFFGMPYEEQAKKLKLDEHETLIRGPENPKSTKTFYRANKVSND